MEPRGPLLSSVEIVRRIAPAVVRLKTPEREGTGFLLGSPTSLVTNLHVVASAQAVEARLHGGREVEVCEVLGTDASRDLAALRLPSAGPGCLEAAADPGVLPGDGVVGPAPSPGEAPWEATVAAVQVLSGWLTVLELDRALPEAGSGGPLMNRRGQLLGVATAARADGAPITLVLPTLYVRPLLEAAPGLPLAALLSATRPPPSRSMAHHSLSILEGSSAVGMELTVAAVAEALQLAAPAHHRGEEEACYRAYEQVARYLVRERADCPGVQSALREGLTRARAFTTASERASALRDTFDALVQVIERWFEGQVSLGLAGRGPPVPN